MKYVDEDIFAREHLLVKDSDAIHPTFPLRGSLEELALRYLTYLSRQTM